MNGTKQTLRELLVNLMLFFGGIFLGVLWALNPLEPSPERAAYEYRAYRHCLQAAGEMRCQMTPQDFVRYYELQRILEKENPTTQAE